MFRAMTHKIRGVRVEEYACYVNKIRQNVGLETWLWRQSVTSQTAHTKYKGPPYATEWTPPWKFSAHTTDHDSSAKLVQYNGFSSPHSHVKVIEILKKNYHCYVTLNVKAFPLFQLRINSNKT